MQQPEMFNELDTTAHARTLANQLTLTLTKVANPKTVEELTINHVLRTAGLIMEALDADKITTPQAETQLLELQAQALGVNKPAKHVTAQDLDTPPLMSPEDLGELF